MYTPLNYKDLNKILGSYTPSMIKAYNNKVFEFWERALFQRACSTLIIDVPEAWDGNVKDFLYYCLFKAGYVVVTDTKDYGIIFQPCTLGGYDIFYQPVYANIGNPVLHKKVKLHDDGELLKLTPDYMGIWDVIGHYAEKLAAMDSGINMSIINTKFAKVWGARNKTAGEFLKKLFDKIQKGEPLIVYDMKLINDPTDKTIPLQIFDEQNLKNNYILTEQLQDLQTILNDFDTEVGIPTIPYAKKERMVVSEAESRQIDATSRSVIWFDTLTSSIKQIKKLYDIDLSVSLRYEEQEEGEKVGKDDNSRITEMA